MPITRDCILKNNNSDTTDTLYIKLDEENSNAGYLLTLNQIYDYCGLEIYIYNPTRSIVKVYDFFYRKNMSTFDQSVDFWDGMSHVEMLNYLINKIPWRVDECSFKQFRWSDRE